MKITFDAHWYKMTDFLRLPFAAAPVQTVVIMLYNLISALGIAINLVLTADFVDTALAIFRGEAEMSRIYITLAIIMATVVYGYVSSTLIGIVNNAFGIRLGESMRSAALEKRAGLEYRHIENNESWELINRVCGDPAGKINGGFSSILSMASIIIRVGSILLIMLTSVWWAALIIIAVSVPLFFLAYRGGKRQYEASREAQKHSRRAQYYSEILSGRENVEERAAFGYTGAINERWHEKYEKARKINLAVELKYFIAMKGASLITVAIAVIIVGVLIFPLARGELSAGMFMALTTSVFSLVQMMSWELSNTVNNLAQSREYLADVTKFSALDQCEGALDRPGVPEAFESIEFRGVSFRYPSTERYILKNFSLKIENGCHYAFVGVNGAGKTTVTKLLCGMYSEYDGEIIINGKELRTMPQSALKSMFSVVYQDFAKYFITVRDNITLGDVNTNDEERMRTSAAMIGLDGAIEALANGYDTYVGKIKEGGSDLSGGQWQRLAIARSLYSRAPVRILDEPTAALDPIAEREVYNLFGEISRAQTTIFITHRLGAARLADVIVVLDGGSVAEIGNHEQLCAKGGIYNEMFEAQKSWYER